MKTAFDKIAAGLNDAIAYAEGDTTRGQIATAIEGKATRAATKKPNAGVADSCRIQAGRTRD